MKLPLRELQEQFQAYILQQESKITSTVTNEHATAEERLNIYFRGYSLRLIDVLEKEFPIFRKHVGEDEFARIAQSYVDQYPSNHFNICTFSRHFSKFLAENNYQDYWVEMAALEWALSVAIDEPDAPQICLADLGTVAGESWPLIKFTIHPSLKFYQFHYNAPLIFKAIMDENETVPEPVYSEKPLDWMVWRFNLFPHFESIHPEQMWMLRAIEEGKTFAEICEGLCQFLAEEQVAEYAAGSLANWIEKGIFSSFEIAEVTT